MWKSTISKLCLITVTSPPKGTSLPPWTNHCDVKTSERSLKKKTASTPNTGHTHMHTHARTHKYKTCQLNFKKLSSEAEERVRERKRNNAHCFFFFLYSIYNQWKFLHNLSQIIQQWCTPQWSVVIVFCPIKQILVWTKWIVAVYLEGSVKWASPVGRWEILSTMVKSVMVTQKKNSEKAVQITLF